jgi:hypothetical protein
MRKVIIALLFLTQFSFAHAALAPYWKDTGTFSNMWISKRTSDIEGYEVRIVERRNGYQGTFQIAEGRPDDLILIESISITDKVRFSFRDPDVGECQFVGEVSPKGLKGRMTRPEGDFYDLDLKRQKSFWD